MWTIAGIVLLVWLPVAALTLMTCMYHYLVWNYVDNIARMFLEKPIFVIPRGNKPPAADEIELKTPDGLTLRAAYWKTDAAVRNGVILFGTEFGSNRWSCVPYCEHLRESGYDIFAYEPRNQGDSDKQEGYEPLQWITDRDVGDCRTAVAYLKQRPDADPRGIGLFGISKGGNAGLAIAAEDPYIRCVLTDGAFATYSTLVPYMRHWYSIFDKNRPLHGLIHYGFYGSIGRKALHKTERERGVKYVHLEELIGRLAPRPLFMIHGEKDSYIRPSMALRLYDCAGEPKSMWIVEGARHNQAIELAAEEYRRRVRDFFDRSMS